MASIDDRYNVKVSIEIDQIMEDGSTERIDTTTKISHNCNRIVMHSIESAIGMAFIGLGDAGIVLLGGEEAAAALNAVKAAQGKAEAPGQNK